MSFKVQVQPSGHEFSVEAEESLLEAALRQGINLPYGCRNGFCGDCRSALIEGDVSYPDEIPEAIAGQTEEACLTCQAHALGDLVIGVHEIEQAAEIRPRILPTKVDRIERLNDDVIRLYLKLNSVF